MASLFFDKSGKGWWAVGYNAGPALGWTKKRLCNHPGWRPGQAPPKRPSDEARRLAAQYEQLERDVKHGARAAPSRTELGAYLDLYLADYRRSGKAPLSVAKVVECLGRYRAFCEGRKLATVQQVTPTDCRAYLAERGRQTNRRGEPLALSTLSLDRALLAPIFARAELDGLIPKNPWAHVKVPKPREAYDDAPPAFWTPEEILAIARACEATGRPWLRDLFLVGVNTGVRISALLAMEWTWIDFGAGGLGELRVPAAHSKGKRPVTIPLSSVAHEVLARMTAMRPRDSCPLVFRGPLSGKRITRQSAGVFLRSAAKAAGLPHERQRICHRMRHTFGTLAANNPNIALPTVKEWLGHADLATTQKYVHKFSEESHRQMSGFALGAAPASVPPRPAAPDSPPNHHPGRPTDASAPAAAPAPPAAPIEPTPAPGH